MLRGLLTSLNSFKLRWKFFFKKKIVEIQVIISEACHFLKEGIYRHLG